MSDSPYYLSIMLKFKFWKRKNCKEAFIEFVGVGGSSVQVTIVVLKINDRLLSVKPTFAETFAFTTVYR